MLRIVNDVLDISKLESGKLELEERDFDLIQLLDGIANSMKTHITQTHKEPVDFVYHIESNVPQIICSDSVRLLQIAYNLLSNASKFTETGKVEFHISTLSWNEAKANKYIVTEDDEEESFTDKDNSKGSSKEEFAVGLLKSMEEGATAATSRSSSTRSHVLKIRVTDSGCGIPAHRIDSIFEPFSQSKISDYRKFGGTGLGLSIIARLTRSMVRIFPLLALFVGLFVSLITA
jgi:signal transduction histidine kinase